MTTAINTREAPSATHLYSQAIRTGELIFCSGQLPVSVELGELVGKDDPAAQTRQVLANIAAVLKAADRSLDDVLADMPTSL